MLHIGCSPCLTSYVLSCVNSCVCRHFWVLSFTAIKSSIRNSTENETDVLWFYFHSNETKNEDKPIFFILRYFVAVSNRIIETVNSKWKNCSSKAGIKFGKKKKHISMILISIKQCQIQSNSVRKCKRFWCE